MKEYTARQFADELNCSTSTVIKWIKKGMIKHRKLKRISKTLYYIPESELIRFKRMLEIYD